MATKAIYYLAAEDTEADPSVIVDAGNGSFPLVEPNGSVGWIIRISEALTQYIPHPRVLLVEENEG